VLIWLPFDKNRFPFMAILYLVLPFVGALAAYWSRRMKGSVLERILSALFPVFAFVALFCRRTSENSCPDNRAASTGCN
jgi:hypothetical protein